MDAAIADTLNRLDAQKIAQFLDELDTRLTGDRQPWHLGPFAHPFITEGPEQNSYRAWLVGRHAWRIPGLHFDGTPADCDWENLFSHLRAEILARRDPQNPPVCRVETPCEMV